MVNWPWSEGRYNQDDTLSACVSDGSPRYRQEGGNGFFFKYDNGFAKYWLGTTVMCSDSDPTKQFFSIQAQDVSAPDQVPADDWRMIRTDRSFHEPAPLLSVTRCGKH